MPDDSQFYSAISNAMLGDSDAPVNELLGQQFAHRIETHRGNYQMSAQSALISAYPVVARLVGEQYMQGLAHAFVQKQPPNAASLTLYGDQFPNFLRQFAPVQKDLPWLAAVAELDRAWFAAYAAADEPPLSASELTPKDTNTLPLLAPKLVASAHLLRFKLPAYSIWKTNKQDQKIVAVDLKKGAEWALVWRQDNQVWHRTLCRSEYVFLTNIEAGLSFAQAYAEARRFEPDFDLQQQFSRWLSAGLFRGNIQ